MTKFVAGFINHSGWIARITVKKDTPKTIFRNRDYVTILGDCFFLKKRLSKEHDHVFDDLDSAADWLHKKVLKEIESLYELANRLESNLETIAKL